MAAFYLSSFININLHKHRDLFFTKLLLFAYLLMCTLWCPTCASENCAAAAIATDTENNLGEVLQTVCDLTSLL